MCDMSRSMMDTEPNSFHQHNINHDVCVTSNGPSSVLRPGTCYDRDTGKEGFLIIKLVGCE